MLTATTRLRPNEAEVAAKVMDGEAIIINLSNGMYYSMDQVGGLIWSLIAEARPLNEIGEAVSGSYDVSLIQAQADVERVAAELLEENLVMPTDQALPGGESETTNGAEKLPYEAPQLNKYRDMGDLLALDPPMPGLDDIPWKEPSEQASH